MATQELGQLGIPIIRPGQVPFSSDYQIRLLREFSVRLKAMPGGRDLLQSFARDSRVTALNGQMVPSGMGRQRFSADLLAMWYLWYANEHGEERAREYLNLFLDSEEIPFTDVLWILGVKSGSSIALRGDFLIRPIHEMPDSSHKELFSQSVYSLSPLHSLAPCAAIVKSCQVKKALPPTQHVPAPTQGSQDFYLRMDEIAWLLNALDGVWCVPYLRTGYSDPTMPLGPFCGFSSLGQLHDVVGAANTMLPDKSEETINDLLDALLQLNQNENARMLRILRRLSQSKRGLQIEDKILDLGIAMEMLLLEDNSSHDQLALSFRLRGSWLLGSLPHEREEVYRQLKNLYIYRSEVAHSGLLCGGDGKKIARVHELFPTYRSLAERAYRKMLKEGRPDWDKLIVGSA